MLAQVLTLGLQLRLVNPGADHLSQFGAVGCDDAGILVARVVRAFGVDQNRLAGRASPGNHVSHVGQSPFAIVRKKHCVVIRQQVGKNSTLGGQHFVLGCVFEVKSKELLLASDDAQLDRCLQIRVAAKVGADAGTKHQRFELVAGLVVADHRQKRGSGAQGYHVVGHVGGTAAAFLFARDAHDGYRRFWRDPIHLSVPVTVQHDITDHQHACPGQGFFRNIHGGPLLGHNSSTRLAG